jgi:hypothetical protein
LWNEKYRIEWLWFWKLTFPVIFLLSFLVTPLYAASFDCNKATTETEIAICSDPELSALDERMGEAWARLSPLFPKANQVNWIHRRDGCGNSYCIKRALEERISFLQNINEELGEESYLSCSVGMSSFNIHKDSLGIYLLFIEGEYFKRISMNFQSHGSGTCQYLDYIGFDGQTEIRVLEESLCSSGELPYQPNLVANVVIGTLQFDCLDFNR